MKKAAPISPMALAFAAAVLLAFSLSSASPVFAQDTASRRSVLLMVTDTVRPAAPPSRDTSRDTSRYGPVMIITTKPRTDTGTEVDVTIKGGDHQKKQLKNVRLSWLNFDFGFNNYVDRSDYGSAEVNGFARSGPGEPEATSPEFALRAGKSVNVNIWPVTATVNIISHHLNLITGIGVEMNNYRYARPVTYVNGPSGTWVITDSVTFKKDKLFTEYLTIPLLLNFESAPYHTGGSFRFSAGPTFGLLVKSRTKQVSNARGKVKNNDPFNLESFRFGLRGEIGFGPVTLYGGYSFTPIHQYGLKQYPFSIGIELISHTLNP